MKVAKTSFLRRWHLCRFLSVGGTNVVFLGIGGTNVEFVEGGTNVVVAVAIRSSGAYVGGKKVAAS
jgi:hypothetical protein